MTVREMSTEELINLYVYANKEWDDEASKVKISSMIKKELKRRFASTIEMLDDWQTKSNPSGTFKNILLGIY